MTGTDEVRAERQAELDASVARLRQRADRLEAQASAKCADFNHYRGDIAWLTQPANPNRPFAKQRERIYRRYDAGVALYREAAELRKRADWMERRGVQVAGDAETRREAERAALDAVIGVGDAVFSLIYGRGEVLKVNRKTYRLRLVSGFEITLDKTLVELPKGAR